MCSYAFRLFNFKKRITYWRKNRYKLMLKLIQKKLILKQLKRI